METLNLHIFIIYLVPKKYHCYKLSLKCISMFQILHYVKMKRIYASLLANVFL